MRIQNPYENIGSMVRHRAISHEHTWYTTEILEPEQELPVLNNARLEACLNRGIDVLAGVSYQPSVPSKPASGFRYSYVDWEFVKDGSGNIVYETDEHGNRKTISYVIGGEAKTLFVPELRRVTRMAGGKFLNVKKPDGVTNYDLDSIVQLPNSEHANFLFPSGKVEAGVHLNFIGSIWGDAVNAVLPDIDQYKEDNNISGLTFTGGDFRVAFPLWTLGQAISNAVSNLAYTNKVFGTINHPGYSRLTDSHIDAIMSLGGDVFKGMEIYNNTDYNNMPEYNISFYDKTLMRGYRLWCLSVNDWGRNSRNPNYPENRGCNLLYLPASYDTEEDVEVKAEMALDAYISGSFSAIGYGTGSDAIDIEDVSVNGNIITVTFNTTVDRVVVDIDGQRNTYNNVSSIYAVLKQTNTFARFEAYKGDDFLFTQPFYVLDKIEGVSLIKKAAVLFD